MRQRELLGSEKHYATRMYTQRASTREGTDHDSSLAELRRPLRKERFG